MTQVGTSDIGSAVHSQFVLGTELPMHNLAWECTRYGCNPMKYPKEISPRPDDFQTRPFSKFQGVPVPVTTKLLRKFVCMAVLPPAKPLAITPAMLQQENLARRPANASHLLKCIRRIGKRAGAKG